MKYWVIFFLYILLNNFLIYFPFLITQVNDLILHQDLIQSFAFSVAICTRLVASGNCALKPCKWLCLITWNCHEGHQEFHQHFDSPVIWYFLEALNSALLLLPWNLSSNVYSEGVLIFPWMLFKLFRSSRMILREMSLCKLFPFQQFVSPLLSYSVALRAK